MAWERIQKKKTGRANDYGNVWIDGPAVSVQKMTISLNGHFGKAFGFASGHIINIFKDVAGKRIGFKKPISQEDQNNAYKVSTSKHKAGKNPPLVIAAREIARCFPECIGRAFAAKLNSGESVIEVDLAIESNGILDDIAAPCTPRTLKAHTG
jgi:hypothetical protein